jgi:hypothetical protein
MGDSTRRELRHMLMRRRNERIAADRDAAGMPRLLRMHDDTLTDLLLDPDPNETFTVDFEGKAFLGIPVLTDPRLERGTVEVDW